MLKENEIYHGDCLEVMKDIEDNSIDCIICDLPYGTTSCKWDIVIPFEDLWEHYKKIIKDNGAICLFGTEPFSSSLRMSNLKMYKYDWIWIKSKATNFLNAKKQPLRKAEIISIFYNKQTIYNPQMFKGIAYNKGIRKNQKVETYNDFNFVVSKSEGSRYPVNTIYYKTAESEGTVFHPTQKPIELLEYMVKTYTKEGELVLDNCIGSGSTAIACINTNRKFIGIEKEKKYYDIA